MGTTYRWYIASGALVQAALLLAACGIAPHNGTVAGNEPSTLQSARASTVPLSGPKRTVLAFGDSLYAGYGLTRGQSLPEVIQRNLRNRGIDATLINAGVSGDTTASGRRRLAYTLTQLGHTPDLVLLGLGGNDALRQVDPAETRANLEAMLNELGRRKIPTVLTGVLAPPNIGPDYSARFNVIWPELARKHGAVLDPFILKGVIGNPALLLPDGMHPNARGVIRIAERVAPLIKARLDALPPDPKHTTTS